LRRDDDLLDLGAGVGGVGRRGDDGGERGRARRGEQTLNQDNCSPLRSARILEVAGSV
jgi:hypothetical protein